MSSTQVLTRTHKTLNRRTLGVAVISIFGDDVGSQRGDFGFSPSFPTADSSFQVCLLHNHDTHRSPLIHQSFFRLIFTATNQLITVDDRPDSRRSSRPSTTCRTLTFFAKAQLFHRSGLSSVFTSPPSRRNPVLLLLAHAQDDF